MKFNNILYVDVGNTAVKFCMKKNDKFLFIKKELIRKFNIQNIISTLKSETFDLMVYSSVRPSLNNKIVDIANILSIKLYNIKELKLKPIFNFIEKKFLGGDLICLIAGAIIKYGMDSIIISMGTATTITLIVDGKFCGVIIIPGLEVAANALFEQAELLKKIDYSFSNNKINRNTTNALNLGIVNSSQVVIEYWINELKKDFVNKKFNIIFTGGNIDKIIIDSNYKRDDYLLFIGIEYFCKINKIL